MNLHSQQRAKNDALITPIFKSTAVKDEAGSKKAGRPIFRDVEMVEVRIAGDRNFMPTFGAHDFWKNVDGIPHTYAMRWPEQYRRFKEGHQQVAEGTPLEELPFLTQAKRSELKALGVFTAETLAALDGKNLKTLGIGGREMKDQAAAYLENASGSAVASRLASENAQLRADIEELRKEFAAFQGRAPEQAPVEPAVAEAEIETAPQFEEFTDDELKEFIASKAGSKPRGTPSRETLVKMASDLVGA